MESQRRVFMLIGTLSRRSTNCLNLPPMPGCGRRTDHIARFGAHQARMRQRGFNRLPIIVAGSRPAVAGLAQRRHFDCNTSVDLLRLLHARITETPRSRVSFASTVLLNPIGRSQIAIEPAAPPYSILSRNILRVNRHVSKVPKGGILAQR